ncbi:hypothetical protein Tco_1015869 [Tanacetum coccineum]|uniref:Uncharacterized protein n=1 Tax=Tanacetum coccineum TaxID=301880 RepID=A0ABQ5FML1_9ASTR
MDDPNITMEEYIRLEEEKARRYGRTFNWQTATFRKVKNYEDEDDHPIDFETKFPAIVFDNTLTAIQSKPTVYSGNDKPLSPNPAVEYFDDLDYFKDLENEFPAIVYNDGLTSKSDFRIKPLINFECIDKINLIDETSLFEYDEEIILRFNDLFNDIHFDDLKSEKDDDDNDIDMAPLPAADQRHPWLRYQIKEHTKGIRHSYEQRLETIWSRPVNRVYVLDFEGLTAEIRAFSLRIYSGEEDDLEEVYLGIGVTHGAGDGRGWAPEKVTGIDLFYLRSIDRGTINVPHLLTQYLFRHAKGRKSEARLSGGHFIRRLAMHFELVSDDGLRGLQVVTRELPLIDLHELGRLHICMRYGQAAEDAALEILAPAQAPPPLPLAPQPRTMSQRIERLEEELMDASGQTYQPFDGTLVGSSGLSFRRCVMPRTSDASTSVAPHTNAQPDP